MNIVALDRLLRKLLFYIEKVCVYHSFCCPTRAPHT